MSWKDWSPERKARSTAATRRWIEKHPEKYRAQLERRAARVRARKAADPEAFAAKDKGYREHYYAKNPDWKLRQILKAYGVTPDVYWQLFKQQRGLCAICQEPEKQLSRLSIDHDHLTNRIRGLLCHSCNKMLGWARDNPDTLQAAVDYLTDGQLHLRVVG